MDSDVRNDLVSLITTLLTRLATIADHSADLAVSLQQFPESRDETLALLRKINLQCTMPPQAERLVRLIRDAPEELS